MAKTQCFIILLLITVVRTQRQNVTVETNVGTFIGYRQVVDTVGVQVMVDKFLGIPFAEPPVGNLRFRKSVPKAPLQEPLVVHRHGPGCIQADIFMIGDPVSEDCLSLNVYAPVNVTGPTEKLPVMVWIYGGGFLFGSSNIYVADQLAAVGKMIVVTFNYRLFALGFLNVPGTDSDANCGLWDQHLAIKWVSENIAKFGGDPARVTVAGESAGAASAVYQGFYSGNAGLFKRIIAQSGTSAVSWAYTKTPVQEAQSFASLVGCPTNKTQAMVTCLKGLPTERYTEKILEVAYSGFPIPFRPSLDNDFVTISPYDLLNGSLDVGRTERQTFASFDLLTGVNTAEGGGLLGPSIGVQGEINTYMPTKNVFDNVLVPICLNVTFGEDAYKVPVDFVRSEYTAWDDDPQDPINIRDQLIDMYSDALYTAPMYRTLNLHAGTSDRHTYMYYFTAAPSSHLFPFASWIDEAAHADELLYLFGELAEFGKMRYEGKFQEWETTLARSFMKLWAQFVRTGNMSGLSEPELDWPQYTIQDRQYLEITRNMTQSTVKQRLQAKRANFWNRLLPMFMQNYVEAGKCKDVTSGADVVSMGNVLVRYALIAVVAGLTFVR